MAIRCSDTLTMAEGERRADALIAAVPARAWQKISPGPGRTARASIDWARIAVRPGWTRGRGHWLLARRSLERPRRDRLLRLLRAPPVQHRRPGLDRKQQVASRNASSRLRTRPGSISTRSAAGGPGTPTSPCPCSPWPGWQPAGPRPKKRDRHQRPGHDQLHPPGDPPPADQPGPGLRTRPRGRGPGPAGADGASTRPGYATTVDAATRSPKCRCSIKVN